MAASQQVLELKRRVDAVGDRIFWVPSSLAESSGTSENELGRKLTQRRWLGRRPRPAVFCCQRQVYFSRHSRGTKRFIAGSASQVHVTLLASVTEGIR